MLYRQKFMLNTIQTFSFFFLLSRELIDFFSGYNILYVLIYKHFNFWFNFALKFLDLKENENHILTKSRLISFHIQIMFSSFEQTLPVDDKIFFFIMKIKLFH